MLCNLCRRCKVIVYPNMEILSWRGSGNSAINLLSMISVTERKGSRSVWGKKKKKRRINFINLLQFHENSYGEASLSCSINALNMK